jgi:hypothetical protein
VPVSPLSWADLQRRGYEESALPDLILNLNRIEEGAKTKKKIKGGEERRGIIVTRPASQLTGPFK